MEWVELRHVTNTSLVVFLLAVLGGRFASSEALRSGLGWLGLIALYAALASVLGRLAQVAQGATGVDAALPVVAFVSLSVVAIGWHVASLARSEKVQSRSGWVGACALFLTLAVFFATLVRQAEHFVLLGLFILLLGMFSTGFLVSLFKTLGAFSQSSSGGEHATH